ncbi:MULTISPECIES: hypothetical protein [Paenibacillus]|uniref:Uncharacterized protein n=2 Tax=Paenibacillus TaxID=44249 RepID=A0ABX2ZAF0_PAEPO|nr:MULTISPECIES: hypothetical protein [Paenibacillus]MDR6779421.1 hypothetical protein [Paenibacillus peoriae]ODA08313.1 hypothetical protein A7312_27640 [Paenibacillus polymyxa]
MLNMGLAENGVDSFKAAFLTMKKIQVLEDGIVHNLKDAVMSLNHGIEILFKLLLKSYDEYLIFADIDKYMTARKTMIAKGLSNVFEANPLLKTVTLNEGIRRAKYLCDYEISEDFETVVQYLNKIRNQFMHYEISLSGEEVEELLLQLRIGYELTYEFFVEYNEDLKDLFEDARYEITIDDYTDEIAEMHRSLMEEELAEQRYLVEKYGI